jgi:hypothetical protein
MQVHLSLGVGTLVALMDADCPAASRVSPDAEEAARIDLWLQADMLPPETEAGPLLCSAPGRPT